MTDLVSHEPRAGAPAKRPPNLEAHLEAHKTATAMALAVTLPDCSPEPDPQDWLSRRWAIEVVKSYGQELEAAVAHAAPPDLLERCRSTLSDILAARPSRKVTMAAVALLVDAKARGLPNPAVYLQAAEYDLVDLGFPPVVVVVALQRLRREMVFMPEIPELIVACEAERDRLRVMLNRVEEASRRRTTLEVKRIGIPALMAKAEAMPEEPRGARP